MDWSSRHVFREVTSRPELARCSTLMKGIWTSANMKHQVKAGCSSKFLSSCYLEFLEHDIPSFNMLTLSLQRKNAQTALHNTARELVADHTHTHTHTHTQTAQTSYILRKYFKSRMPTSDSLTNCHQIISNSTTSDTS